MKKPRNLGRGLTELLCKPDDEVIEVEAPSEHKVTILNVRDIVSSSTQPRKHFDQEALQNLANSIAQQGLISPITVRRGSGGKFEIIAGERRYKAAQIAGLTSVPVIIKDADNTLALELSIIENIQREDLNAIEEAEAYQALIDKYSYTQEDISTKLSKSRSHIANTLRLLSLPMKVIVLVKEGKISAGHAKALIGHEAAESLVDEIVAKNLTVRDTERLTSKSKKPRTTGRAKFKNDGSIEADEEILVLESLLNNKLGMRVRIDNTQKNLTIWYEDLGELDVVLQLLSAKR